MQAIRTIFTTKWYWLGSALLGFSMLAVALFYQYSVGDEPCQVCIHVRIWVAAFTLLSLVMCILPRRPFSQFMGQLLLVFSAAGMWERSWYLYKLENGIGDGSCEFYLGFPGWFALDKWFPFIFEVRNLCSYTPELLLGITMAEGLVAIASALIAVALWGLYLNVSSDQ
ncbi:disulfide bond formation protein B [Pseudomaricurvus alkylphenolicus]|nr:disulfide bond formation protein B [Pseudomaricurvus alkylphenolicus]NIB38720.1 disulfide bond formation protein B [Pseudomaricurvus alkylphenolicus]